MKRWLSTRVVPLIFYAFTLQADEPPRLLKDPWFTGPLLTSSPYVVTKDHFNIEPYFYVNRVSGTYDANWKKQKLTKFWSYQFQLPVQVGLTSWLDFSITPQVLHNRRDATPSLGLSSASSTQFTDLPIYFGIQFLKAQKGDWYPSIGLQITETFPTGRFEKLDPLKRKMDVGGAGAYTTMLVLLFGKLFHISGDHGYLSTRGYVSYSISHPVHVKGFNTYGGGIGTEGHVRPGSTLEGLIGLEYALTLNWVVAIDFDYTHVNKCPFKGHSGFLAPGIPAKVGFPSSEQFSLAPALEYNWSDSLGVVAGVWFSVLGRNQLDFTAGVAAFNWYY